MPVPLPTNPRLGPPDAEEVSAIARALASAAAPSSGLTELQGALLEAQCESMTGFTVDAATLAPITPKAFAEALAARDHHFRERTVQAMLLLALVLRPLPPEVAAQLEAFAAELGVEEGMLAVANRYAAGNLGLAAFDFQRNGYTRDWSADRAGALHTSAELAGAWEACVKDEALAARWRSLEPLPAGTLGGDVARFYRARGFAYPGTPGSAPPLLAQHDWVHVLAGYGSTVESELEVFAFIARANDDPRGFSLLAMVVSLFETGYLRTGAGLFEAFPGQLSREGMAVRVSDAMRRGARTRTALTRDVDLLAVDWFDLAEEPTDDVRGLFRVEPKSAKALAAGSVGPFDLGGISEYQEQCGRELAAAEDRPYESFGATVP